MESCIHALPIPDSIKNIVPEVTRRSANFHPSIWGDHFLAYASHAVEVDVNMEQPLQQLKEEPSQKLNFIDAIQRLGVSYHFETEIEAALQHIYETYYDHHDDKANGDLYTVALSFRLLRQQGHPVSCNVFNKFKDNNGKFHEYVIGDVQGMLSLYEATHLRMRGEEILDEALVFTTTHLKCAILNLSNPLKEQSQAYYIFFYEQDDSHNEVLLNFAKLDFNLLQKTHQWELSEITRWWKDLDFAKKLPFARDRLVECYFWILGVYFEPQYFLARRILTKVIALTSIIDDIYDAYGTLEELELFTDAVERWESSALDQLPEYMKLCYQALLDVYNMIDEEMSKQERSYRVHYTKSTFEQKRGHAASAVECYMKQHGATEEEVLVEFRKLVTNAWKDINAAYLRPTAVPMPLLLRIVNLTRMIHVIYKDEDGYTHSGTRVKAFVTSVLSAKIARISEKHNALLAYPLQHFIKKQGEILLK
ncbi:hypothetical protein HYC85_014718 [Camellia sinensis]|uniref:Uncharacterized protein n=1 Tax=Camellia sinensis TaxID=4442 RepID=A0A7J7H915_CAMSI|nr:hypothetical protein HYC85_014718 [Camellia sinensis]